MCKRLAEGMGYLMVGLVIILAGGLLAAQNITIPNTFVNGTVADAPQVNANFAALSANACNRAACVFSGTPTPNADNTIDLGSAALRFANVYGFNGNFKGNTILGDAAADTVTVNGTLLSSLLPTHNTFDLGALATAWRDLFLSRNLAVGGATTLSSTLDVGGTVTLSTGFRAGGGAETFGASGVINVDSTQATTPSSTVDTALFTYSLPASSLSANGRIVKVTAWGSVAGNGNTKTIRLKWNGLTGTTITANTSSVVGQKWTIIGHIIRTGSNAQDVMGYILMASPSQDLSTNFTTAAATDTAAIDIVVSGQNGSASPDITYEGSIIEFAN